MDVILVIAGLLLLILGFIGCIIPVLPGPPLSFIGLLLFHWTKYVQYSPTLLWILGIMTVLITVIDQILPAWMTKRSGGSKYGTWGSTIGLIVGFFTFPPIGIILCPFLGALIGELIYGSHTHQALKAAMFTFWGFLLGIGIKLILTGVIAYYYFKELWTLIVE